MQELDRQSWSLELLNRIPPTTVEYLLKRFVGLYPPFAGTQTVAMRKLYFPVSLEDVRLARQRQYVVRRGTPSFNCNDFALEMRGAVMANYYADENLLGRPAVGWLTGLMDLVLPNGRIISSFGPGGLAGHAANMFLDPVWQLTFYEPLYDQTVVIQRLENIGTAIM